MPEITLTETQREELAAIQADLEAAYVDTYGHVRVEDAVQYLIDTYTPPAEQSSDADRDRVATADIDDPTDAATDGEAVSADEASGEAVAEAASNGDDDADSTAGADVSDDTDEEDDSPDSTAGSPSASDGPGSILSAANQLLTTHDEKWRKSGGEEPYEVDLPDGTTEAVRTKDDVRGLLFKHY